MAGPPQLTGEHRGERAEWPAPSALLRALAFNSGKRKTKQNKAKWAGAGVGQGEKTPPNRSLHPQRTQQSWDLGCQGVGCPGP